MGLSYVRVANESTEGISVAQIPKTKSLVPGSRDSVLTVGRQGNIGDEVIVTRIFSMSFRTEKYPVKDLRGTP